jgi:hypothetical protein
MFRQIMSRSAGIIILVVLAVMLFVWLGADRVLPEGANITGLWQRLSGPVLEGERQVQGPVAITNIARDGRSRELLLLNHVLASDISEDGSVVERIDALALTYLSQTNDGWQVGWDHKLGQSSTAVPLRAINEGNAIYLLTDNRLLRLDRLSGNALWEVSLRDSAAPNCTTCLALFDDRVVVLTGDYYLTGLDANTGQPIWDVRLNRREGDPPPFTQIDNTLAIVDHVDGSSRAAALFFYDGRTGQIAQIIEPVCTDPDGQPLAPLRLAEPPYFHPERQMVDFLLGGGNSYRCVQRWHYPSGRLQHTLLYDPPSLTYDPARSQPEPHLGRLFRADDLFVGGEGTMTYVHIPTGDKWNFLDEPDYTFYPERVADDMLLVLAIHNEEATYELWGLDLATLSPQWRHETGRRLPPLRPGETSGSGRWAFNVTTYGVVVVDIVGHQGRPFARVDILDTRTGAIIQGHMTQVYDSHWTGITWYDEAAYLTLRRLHRLDLQTGIVTWEWPNPQPDTIGETNEGE